MLHGWPGKTRCESEAASATFEIREHHMRGGHVWCASHDRYRPRVRNRQNSAQIPHATPEKRHRAIQTIMIEVLLACGGVRGNITRAGRRRLCIRTLGISLPNATASSIKEGCRKTDSSRHTFDGPADRDCEKQLPLLAAPAEKWRSQRMRRIVIGFQNLN
jgi:hypothetical protein